MDCENREQSMQSVFLIQFVILFAINANGKQRTHIQIINAIEE